MKVSFVIPFHNEGKNIIPMLDQVYKYCLVQQKKWDFEIIPVNDRSNDNTAEILDAYAKKQQRVKPVHRLKDMEAKGNSMGNALLEGSQKATGEIIVWTMGDRADDPQTYGKIVEKIRTGYDLVFGSRYMPGGTWGSLDPTKAYLSANGTVLARFLFQIQVHDITNAFRGFRKGLLSHLRIDSSGFAISPEFAIKAHLAGYRLGEVPTIYYDRVEGVSNFKLWHMSIEYLKVYVKLFLGTKILSHRDWFREN